ncbi:Uncharacterized protein FWK35_00012246 [Aphis craccivora]|uniref:G-protein coupled receptors family 1 profile domain-containing protein n=1 Tax=Aphis craccivora TaxID=307492 RepID=A0A6G0ZH19_APHCR|nr:Uncharacterized protein FWK35_00012246 [Aphis craccivora]
MGSGHDDGAGKVWLAQVICRLVYSVYQDNGHYYHNGSATTAATTAAAAAATAAATTAATAAAVAVAGTEMVMTATTNDNKLLVTEARVDRLDCGGTWTLDCRRAAGALDGQQWPPATTAGAADDADDRQRWYNWKYLFVVVFIASGGVGNILVCLAICLDRQLQNVTNYFLLSLAIADLLVCLFVMPLGAIPGFYVQPEITIETIKSVVDIYLISAIFCCELRSVKTCVPRSIVKDCISLVATFTGRTIATWNIMQKLGNTLP